MVTRGQLMLLRETYLFADESASSMNCVNTYLTSTYYFTPISRVRTTHQTPWNAVALQ